MNTQPKRGHLEPQLAQRDAAERPVHKLTVSLIGLYKSINKLYYENRAKAREDQGKSAWEDENHDYIIVPGEDILNRYIVRGRIGKGSFGQVLRAFDKVTKNDVAIKMIKNKTPFKNQANTEIDILLELKSLDSIDEHHFVRLLDHFEHRGHPCLIFEHLSYNLYELLRNTKFRGVSLPLIAKFSLQALDSLSFLRAHNIIHCDLKPENILLCQPKRSAIKLIDFGSSCHLNRKTFSYIQSRFYRSPEIIIGVAYSFPIDMWSLGCILVEMHTGEPVFSGVDSHDQLFKTVRILGPVPNWMKIQAQKRDRYFMGGDNELIVPPQYAREEEGGFLDLPPKRTLRGIIGVDSGGPSGRRQGERGHDLDHYEAFLDFVSCMLRVDPNDRILPGEALQHRFLHSSFWADARKKVPSNRGERRRSGEE